MTGIDSAMLASMRSAIGELLPDTCNIITLTNSPDGEGGVTVARGTSGTAIACRLDVKASRQQVTGGAVEPYLHTVLSLPYDTIVTSVNQIEHGGHTYSIVGPTNSDGSWLAVIRLELELVA